MKRAAAAGLLLFFAVVMAENENGMPLYLNHFYITLDSITYSAIENDAFLKEEFAAFEQRTTVRTDKTYTGTYFYGASTYFEFFDAGAQQPGASGIAFGVESEGATRALQEKFPKTIPTVTDSITRRWNDVDHPWFLMLAPSSGFSEKLSVWVMEYDPRFLKQWRPEAATPEQGITRSAILDRYKAVLAKVPKEPLLQNVAALTVAAIPEDKTALENFCVTAGYRKKENTLTGPDVQLHLVDLNSGKNGIVKVDFVLQRDPAELKTRVIGNSVLSFHGNKTATWQFFR